MYNMIYTSMYEKCLLSLYVFLYNDKYLLQHRLVYHVIRFHLSKNICCYYITSRIIRIFMCYYTSSRTTKIYFHGKRKIFVVIIHKKK